MPERRNELVRRWRLRRSLRTGVSLRRRVRMMRRPDPRRRSQPLRRSCPLYAVAFLRGHKWQHVRDHGDAVRDATRSTLSGQELPVTSSVGHTTVGGLRLAWSQQVQREWFGQQSRDERVPWFVSAPTLKTV